jgi:predicted ribosomally synthesized peptide with SipW-like signal peptide
MRNMRAVFSLIIIVVAITMVGGATMAWFTDTSDPIDNEFTAGTVAIEANRSSHATKTIEENWNPGDCTDLEVCVENEGTKAINLRAKVNQSWLPSALRLLVIYTPYTDDPVQLLAVEWDSTCKGCTGTEGPIASGTYSFSYPGTSSYMVGTFKNLTNQTWIQNGTGYLVWCADSQTGIRGTKQVDIYDPFCNENWHEEVQTLSQWDNIPWAKIVYIINQGYLTQGYAVMDIQQAIWFFTNGSFETGEAGDLLKAQEIVDDVETNWELPISNVTLDIPGWTDGGDGWWYLNDEIPGTFSGAADNERTVCMSMDVCLLGAETGNEYQGAQYWVTVLFEAIQSSNFAPYYEWNVNYFGTPD